MDTNEDDEALLGAIIAKSNLLMGRLSVPSKSVDQMGVALPRNRIASKKGHGSLALPLEPPRSARPRTNDRAKGNGAIVRVPADRDATMACADNLAFMRELPSESMKLIVTSPPYNIGKSYERRRPLNSYVKDQQQVIAECVRLLHPSGSICWQVGNHVETGEVFPLDVILYQVFKEHRLKLRNRIIWHFEHGLHCSNRLSGRHEAILWFTKSNNYTFNLNPIRVPSKYPNKKYYKGPKAGQVSSNPLGKNPGDVWVFPNVKNNHVEKTIHPCQFPVELVERLVLSMTNVGDRVLDPYMGIIASATGAMWCRNT